MKNIFKKLTVFVLCASMIFTALAMSSCQGTGEELNENKTESATKEQQKDPAENEWVAIPRLIASLKKGTVITGDHIMMTVADAKDIPEGAAIKIDDIIGKYINKDVNVGAYLYEKDLSATEIKPDEPKKEPTAEELVAQLREELEAELRAEIEAQIKSEMENNGGGTAQPDGTVSVLRVVMNIRKGTKITAEHVMPVNIPEESVPEGAIVKFEAVVGKYAKNSISLGSYIYPADISISAVTPDGSFDPETEKLKEQLRAELEAELRDEIREEVMAGIATNVQTAADLGYVIITDYLAPNTGKDVSATIQSVINANPNKTIYFPDGEYILGSPIATSGKPSESVSLHLSNYATLKASSSWSNTEAMVRLGGAKAYNDINTNGSNYYFYGGIVDGNGKAKGISIDSGRETSIRNVSIKHTSIGIHIKHGANSGSSDADIDTVNIVGNNTSGSIGVLVEGYDNTLTNMRIASVQTGVKLIGAGNFMRNLHPLFIYGGNYNYTSSVGFDDQSGGNWYDFCYSDQFAVGFKMKGNTLSTYQTCFCFWYKQDSMQVGFKSTGKFNSTIWNSKVNLTTTSITSAYIQVANTGGGGRIECPIFNTACCNDATYKTYLKGEVMWTK
ncbi:MAG: hypothetical protein E7642_03975 [Ruminococcaceae bacterium]|nr:hypothetical protein [Oscillospiraceae bacterium]